MAATGNQRHEDINTNTPLSPRHKPQDPTHHHHLPLLLRQPIQSPPTHHSPDFSYTGADHGHADPRIIGPWSSKPARGIFHFPTHDIGPPSWVKAQRVQRAFWRIQLPQYLISAVQAGKIVWPYAEWEVSRGMSPTKLREVPGMDVSYPTRPRSSRLHARIPNMGSLQQLNRRQLLPRPCPPNSPPTLAVYTLAMFRVRDLEQREDGSVRPSSER
ncbi:hypothetical protein IFR05_004764 [Cadophora sp. M221]|nr:hypothetical protein IFR05_004764 [Cadophora sp. M221]